MRWSSPARHWVIVAAIASLTACGGEEKSAAPVQAAAIPLAASAVAEARAETINPSFTLPAIVETPQEARVLPEVSARVAENHFVAGDQVQKGALLVSLAADEFKVRFDQAQAQHQSALANLTEADSTWQRAQELKPDGYISQQDFDRAKADFEVATAAVAGALANLESAQLDLDRTQVFAPFTGRISKPGHGVGDLVSPGSQTPLFTLVQLDPIYVSASVELSIYNRFVILRNELLAQGRDLPELAVTALLAGDAEYPFSGRFLSWDNSAQGSRGTILGRSEFPNPDGLLLPGQNVRLQGRAVQPVEAILIPQAAVLSDQQGQFVLRVGPDSVLERANIETSIRDGADWVIREGLAAGDRVVASGAQRLAPGTRVDVTTPQG